MSRYRSLVAEPLTREAFALFGDVIDTDGAESFPINQGRTERFHALSRVELSGATDRGILSIFRGQPLTPLEIALMERHPLGSQSFIPMNNVDFLAVVAPPGDFDEAAVRVFLVKGHQGVTYHAGTWHAPLLPLTADADYLVVDRQGLGQNCDEVDLQQSIKPILANG
ncbi:ureidoglycolate lyase [uncultured Marinobacter sp.]|jgi:ureidoglycolate lyase|nr:ureidoglycolate lyase [uncultured Marinobacter sp.]MBI47025.1 ureidoglycolate lyase [Marinobacter sp.]MEC7727182.1 ureidoglycolate lyase [Pseudomonadota bacterium]OUW75951.1 MAG: ureidoglycolate lyase [Saprospirales bacterium TMED214]|tara:strand:- start:4715 stop:5218 length:504 start_codon:yes stop_codon:yes gene_type:complete